VTEERVGVLLISTAQMSVISKAYEETSHKEEEKPLQNDDA
jgi:hypothetical protein